LPFREWNKLKTYNCIVFTDFEHTELYPFQNLSLGFILNFRLDILIKYILVEKKSVVSFISVGKVSGELLES